MKECLKCKKQFEDKKPTAKFCSVSCRVGYNQIKKRERLKELELLFKSSTFNTDGESRANFDLTKPRKETTEEDIIKIFTKQPTVMADEDDIRRRIAAIKAEKIPKERDTFFGRKSWKVDQANKIQELETLLSNPRK